MEKNKDNTQKCEFLLKLNDNIVCQRYFTVRNFNNKAANSLDLHETVSWIMYDLRDDLKHRTCNLLDSNYIDKLRNKDVETAPEHFSLTIKIGTREVYVRIMRADIYPPKVRFSVDIRPQLNRILKELTQVLSSQKVTCNYQDYSLNVW